MLFESFRWAGWKLDTVILCSDIALGGWSAPVYASCLTVYTVWGSEDMIFSTFNTRESRHSSIEKNNFFLFTKTKIQILDAVNKIHNLFPLALIRTCQFWRVHFPSFFCLWHTNCQNIPRVTRGAACCGRTTQSSRWVWRSRSEGQQEAEPLAGCKPLQPYPQAPHHAPPGPPITCFLASHYHYKNVTRRSLHSTEMVDAERNLKERVYSNRCYIWKQGWVWVFFFLDFFCFI